MTVAAQRTTEANPRRTAARTITAVFALLGSACTGQIYQDAAHVEPRQVNNSVDDTLADQRCEERSGPWSVQTCPPSVRAARAFDERQRLKAAAQSTPPAQALPTTKRETAVVCAQGDAACATDPTDTPPASTSPQLLDTLSAGLSTSLVADAAPAKSAKTPAGTALRTHYMEIVTDNVYAQCAALASLYNLSFSEPVADLGLARVAQAPDGTLIGVRAPLAEHETATIRTYLAVDDIDAALQTAAAAGATIAYPPTRQGDTGTWAIYILGGNQFGLWQK